MASLEKKKSKDLVILHVCYSNNPQISDWLFTHTICLLLCSPSLPSPVWNTDSHYSQRERRHSKPCLRFHPEVTHSSSPMFHWSQPVNRVRIYNPPPEGKLDFLGNSNTNISWRRNWLEPKSSCLIRWDIDSI